MLWTILDEDPVACRDGLACREVDVPVVSLRYVVRTSLLPERLTDICDLLVRSAVEAVVVLPTVEDPDT